MPKNQIKPEAEAPYSEQTSLGGPIMKIGTPAPLPCRLSLSSKILAVAGLKPRDQVQLIAEEGQIIIKKIGEPDPGYPILKPGPKPQLDDLMQWTREKMARARGEYDEEEEPEEPLNAEQIELLQMDQGEIRVAEYLVELPPREMLEAKLHEAIRLARGQAETRGKKLY